MPATSVVQTDIDFDVKERAATVLNEMGISVSDAVRLFLTRTANEGALPFSLNNDGEAHDRWFRAKVQEALDDPRPSIPNEQVEAYFDKRKADLLATLESAQPRDASRMDQCFFRRPPRYIRVHCGE